jgi:hypothetical protein
MAETDLDRCRAQVVAGEEMGWSLRERDESLRRSAGAWSGSEPRETGRAWLVVGIVGIRF